jgi:hypothetical protein
MDVVQLLSFLVFVVILLFVVFISLIQLATFKKFMEFSANEGRLMGRLIAQGDQSLACEQRNEARIRRIDQMAEERHGAEMLRALLGGANVRVIDVQQRRYNTRSSSAAA